MRTATPELRGYPAESADGDSSSPDGTGTLALALQAVAPLLLVFAVAVAPPGCGSSSARAAERPAPVFTRDLGFTIPFSVESSATDIVEVQLLVSLDRGATWQLYLRQAPTEKGFRFRGQRDGEYWFASRTIDRLGQARPSGPLEPQLIVVIDTTAPRLNLTVAAGAAGEIQARWEMSDERLSPQSFQLFYMAGVAGAPQPVAAPPATAAAGGAYQGQVAFFPQGGARLAQVVAEVKDAAGNRVVATKRVYVNPASRPPTNPANPWAAQGPWGNPGQYPANTLRPAGPAGPGQFAAATTSPAGSSTGPTTVASPVAPAGNPTGTPASGPPAASSPYGAVPPGPAPPGAAAPYAAAPYAAAPYAAAPYAAAPASSPNAFGNIAANSPATGASSTGAAPLALPLGGDLPGGERPRMTNTKRFALEYDIESAGPGGVAEVELWMTRDRGASWTKHSSDADKQSPFDVTVAEEAIYGFRIVIVSKSGLASSAPRPGDLADLWIGVDTTPPRTQLTSISFGEGPEAGKLDIRWEADDARLGPRPVSLMYAENAAGPWNTVAAGLPNSGQYYWPMAGIVPKRALLRIEVRDEAGNLGTYQLSEPINLQGLNPAGRIRAFAPAAAAPSSGYSPSSGSSDFSSGSSSSGMSSGSSGGSSGSPYDMPSSGSSGSSSGSPYDMPSSGSSGGSSGSPYDMPSSGSSGGSSGSPYDMPSSGSSGGSSNDFSSGSGANAGARRIPLFGTRRR